jgi:hypothetical protein
VILGYLYNAFCLKKAGFQAIPHINYLEWTFLIIQQKSWIFINKYLWKKQNSRG